MKINYRLIRLMCLMAEHGFITANEIDQLYIHKTVRLRYLSALKTHGLIGSFDTHCDPGQAYYLNDAGYKYLESVGDLRVLKRFIKSEYQLLQFSHTIVGLQMRLLFQKYGWAVAYQPELVVAYYRALQGGKEAAKEESAQCDAELIVKTPANEYKTGIKLELTTKSFGYLTRVIKSIDVNRDDLYIVLWVVSGEMIIRDLQSAFKTLLPQLRYPQKHLFARWHDLKTKQINTVWFDADGSSRKLFA